MLRERNDPLLNSFEAHLLLANLGNIDWRPLINLWAVLAYLTKYSAKASKPTKQLTSLLDEVLTDVTQFEKEDGSTDLWKRTIMKFYNRVLGNRDYTLFEVVHHGLGLPPTISSFGDVENASLSDWHSMKTGAALTKTEDDDIAFHMNKKEQFAQRGDLILPRNARLSDISNLSFYAFCIADFTSPVDVCMFAKKKSFKH